MDYFSRNWIIKLSGDVLLIIAAYYLAFFLRFDGYVLPQFQEIFLNSVPLVLLVKAAVLFRYGSYSSYWRYAGLSEELSLLKGLTLSSLIIVVSYWLATGFTNFPRAVFLLDWILSVIFLSGLRILPRLFAEMRNHLGENRNRRNDSSSRGKTVLLYGAGDLGASVLRQIKSHFGSEKHVVGFLDDDPLLNGMYIEGVPVLGGRSELKALSQIEEIDEIIVAISAITGRELKSIVEYCREFSGNVRVAPSLDEIFAGKVRISDFRTFQIEDLLGRERVEFNTHGLDKFLEGKKVLVTGAGGSIGSELCYQILKFAPSALVLFGRGENSIYAALNRLKPHVGETRIFEVIGNVIDREKLDRVFSQHRPDIVFHAAANKHVPLMEINPDEAVMSNVIGTENVLELASKHQAEKVVCISSDKAVNPRSVMGCCKRVTELFAQHSTKNSNGAASCSVRFGNVMGSRGSVIPLFKQQIREKQSVTVTHPEIRRYFMTIPEAVLLVLQAGSICEGGEIFLLEMGKPIRIVHLAREMIRLAGYTEAEVPIRFIGLRPGEKLNEELSFDFEKVEQTSIPKLQRLSSRSINQLRLKHYVDQLREFALQGDFEGIRAMLKIIVPEYECFADEQGALEESLESAKQVS